MILYYENAADPVVVGVDMVVLQLMTIPLAIDGLDVVHKCTFKMQLMLVLLLLKLLLILMY